MSTSVLQIHGRPVELSPREMQTLKLIAAGKCLKEVAFALGVTKKTVEKFAGGVMRKLDIHDRVLLAHYAISRGLVPNIFSHEPTQ